MQFSFSLKPSKAQKDAAAQIVDKVVEYERRAIGANLIPEDEVELYAHAAALCADTQKAGLVWGEFSEMQTSLGAVTHRMPPHAALTDLVYHRINDHLNGYMKPDMIEEPVETFPTFPRGVFSDKIEEYIDMICDSQQVDRGLVAVGIIAMTAAATMGKYAVCHPDSTGHFEELALYIVGLAYPSERKSAVLKYTVTRPLNDFLHDGAVADEYGRAVSEYTAKRRSLNAMLQALEKMTKKATEAQDEAEMERLDAEMKKATAELAALQPPVDPDFRLDDSTPEAIAAAMVGTGELAFLASDEAAALEILAGIYNAGGTNHALLNHAINAESTKVNRVREGGKITLKRPLITMLQLVQPDVYARIEADDRLNSTGFIARVLRLSVPERETAITYENKVPFDKSLYDEYKSIIGEFLNIKRPDGLPKPIRFGEDAAKIMVKNMQSIQNERVKGGKYSEKRLCEATGKLCGYTERIAAILHLLNNPTTGSAYQSEKLDLAATTPISAKEAESACKICDFFLQNMIEDTKTEEKELTENSKKLLEKIIMRTVYSGKAYVSKADIKREARHNKGLSSQFEEILTDLIDGKFIDVSASRGRSRERTDVFINPEFVYALFDIREKVRKAEEIDRKYQ